MKKVVSTSFKKLAQLYIKTKKPCVAIVAGSVGKTSTKLAIGEIIKGSNKTISYMDDSYNTGLGLYMSTFELKVPENLKSVKSWLNLLQKANSKFFKKAPDIILLEYGIDHPGDMQEMVDFIKPDAAILTAATPEHMEFMKTLDNVGKEETDALRAADKIRVVNADDVNEKYYSDINSNLFKYGKSNSNSASYKIKEWTKRGAIVDFIIENHKLENISVNFISEPLIRQLTGAALFAYKLGVDIDHIARKLSEIQPTFGRMRVFNGVNDSIIVDDSVNFSPVAGVESLKALKNLQAKRHIAVLGSMKELGDFEKEGYKSVAKQFNGLDAIFLTGKLSTKYFKDLAINAGFELNKNLFLAGGTFDTAEAVKQYLQPSDAILVKGPFDGEHLEELVKYILKDKSDKQYLTRQSSFWFKKKSKLFNREIN